MKKLLLVLFLLLRLAVPISAQSPTVYQNSLSLAVAPNVYFQFPLEILSIHTFVPSIGYTVGLDYSRNIGQKIYGKLGIRYHTWYYKDRLGPLQWPSENQNGQYVYDPTLDHYLDTKVKDHGWQVSVAAGWHSKPGRWQWRTGLELGAIFFAKSNNVGFEKPRATVGFVGGPECSFNPRTHFFVQPGGQISFKKTAKNGVDQGFFLSFQWETGVRYQF